MIILFFILLYPSFLVGYILFHYIKDYISFKISTKKFHKKYDIKKSDQKRIVFFQEIGLKEFFNCFSNHRDHKYHYLGISWNIFHENHCFFIRESFTLLGNESSSTFSSTSTVHDMVAGK